jgi:type IV secretion system protein VirB10
MTQQNSNIVSSLEGEDRGIPSVAARKEHTGGDPKKKIIGAIFILLPIILLGVYLYFSFSKPPEVVKAEEPKKSVAKAVEIPKKTFVLSQEAPPIEQPSTPLPAEPVDTPTPESPPSRKGPHSGNGGSLSDAPHISKSGNKMLLSGSGASGGGSRAGASSPYQAQNELRLQEAQMALATSTKGEEKGAMKGMLEGTTTKMNHAIQLQDRNYLIAKGTILQCALQTKIVTSVAGMTKCVMPTNIYSDNGKVLLLERGSEITGEFQAGMKQGQPRIFVLWTRIKTPTGIVVDLSSPGTGQLGESGVDGYIDTHFWKRFGGAIMLSMIDDLGNSIVKERNNSTINLGGTSDSASDMASEALQNSINIPPTLYKNQGEAVAIYLARDLDFRGVYDLRPE